MLDNEVLAFKFPLPGSREGEQGDGYRFTKTKLSGYWQRPYVSAKFSARTHRKYEISIAALRDQRSRGVKEHKTPARGVFTPSKRVVPFAALRQIGAARLKHGGDSDLCGGRLKALP